MASDEYFTTRAGGAPTEPGRYVDTVAMESVEVLPGLSVKPVTGRRTMVNFVCFAPFTAAPIHVHAEEQVAIVIEGELEMDIDGDVRTLHAGQLAVIPAWVPHGMRTYQIACREMDIFSPPRHALLERLGGLTASSMERG
jgi:quercetin dioxygenase-like cupin family protein